MSPVATVLIRILAPGWFVCAALGVQEVSRPGTRADPPRYADDVAVVHELRVAGRLEEAQRAAEDLFERGLDDARLPVWFLGDLERELETLSRALELPATGRAELVEAARLGDAWLVSFRAGERELAREQAAHCVTLLVRQLGAEHPDVAWARVDLAWREAYLQRSRAFLDEAQRALDVAVAAFVDEHPLVAVCLGTLGWAQIENGFLEQASQSFLAARDLWLGFDSGLDVHAERRAFPSNGLAILASAQGRFDDADRWFLECVELVRRAPGEESESYANLLGTIGSALVQRGELQRAEPLLERALSLNLALLPPENPAIAAALNNLALVRQAVGDYAAVEAMLEEALAIAGGVAATELQIAILLNNLARVNTVRGRLDVALDLAERAVALGDDALAERLADRAVWVATLAEIHLERGELDRAQELFEESHALATDRFGDDDPDARAALLAASGRILLERGDLDGAAQEIGSALAVNEKLLTPSHPLLATLRSALARIELARGDLVAAEARFTEATAIEEVARLRVRPGVQRATFAAESSQRELAWIRAALGDPEGAWRAQEAGRGRTSFEAVLAAQARRRDPELGRSFDALQTELFELEETRAHRDDLAGRTRSRMLAIEAELGNLLLASEAKRPVTEGKPYDLERVRATLAADEALVGWIEGASAQGAAGLWSWTLRRTGPIAWTFRADKDGEQSLTDGLRAQRDALADAALDPFAPGPDAVRPLARELGARLFGVLEEAGALEGVGHVIVVASRPVLGVPLESLVVGEQWVDERWSLTYVPSCTVHAWLVERPAPAPATRRVLLIGDPPFRAEHLAAMKAEDGVPRPRSAASSAPGLTGAPAEWHADPARLPRIAGTRTEVLRIAELYPQATLLVGAEATERAVGSQDLSRFAALHIATHALVDDQRPDRSALVLAQTSLPDPIDASLRSGWPEDGLVTAGEIARRWELDASLVTLSACDTALGRHVPGEGYLGLAQALLQAGARSVLASLWSVDDRATARFMVAFHRAWRAALEDGARPARAKAEALRAARRTLREHAESPGVRPFAHPGTWSAFILIGDPD